MSNWHGALVQAHLVPTNAADLLGESEFVHYCCGCAQPTSTFAPIRLFNPVLHRVIFECESKISISDETCGQGGCNDGDLRSGDECLVLK